MRTSIVIAVYLLSISVLHGQLTPPHYLFQAPYGGATNVYLINPNFKRCQLLYTQSDLAQMVAPINSGIQIDSIFLRYGVGSTLSPGPYSYTYTGLRIKMAHTDVNILQENFSSNFAADPGTLVFEESGTYTLDFIVQPGAADALETAADVWTAIPLSTPFAYDGVGNILIEITFESLDIPFISSGLQMDFSAALESAIAGEEPDAETAEVILYRPYIGFSGESCPTTSTNLQAMICPGGSFNFQGQLIDQAGTYSATLENYLGCDSIITLELQVSNLAVEAVSIYNYNGFDVSCADNNDGGLEAQVSGGSSPYFYNWSNGETEANLQWLEAGNYLITVVDASGCTAQDQIELLAPAPLEVGLETTAPLCTDEKSGMITLYANGGVEPYSYRLNNGAVQNAAAYDTLSAGLYTIQVSDLNGCNTQVNTEVPSSDGFDLELSPNNTVVKLGESLSPNVYLNAANIDSIQWAPADGLSCTDCLEPDIQPLRSTVYTLTVVDEAGCTEIATLDLGVYAARQVYFPNVFSPNFDGLNDIFTGYGGIETTDIISLKVFDRWGSLIYDGRNLPMGSEAEGWDGRNMNNEKMPAGTYTYLAMIRFVDGQVLTTSGAILLIR